jgi:hypothetical protein
MIGRLTLNLRMYDPAATAENSHPPMSKSLKFNRSQRLASDETRTGETVSIEESRV